MRPRTPAALCLGLATAFLPLLPTPAHADPTPACATPDTRDFPLTTRLHGGPASYRAGGGHGTWYLDLTNTTGRACTGIHPVVVLVDGRRALKPTQPHLAFYAGGRPHPVRFEATDEDELVGAFTDTAARFPGFTIGPRRTVTVEIRLSFTADAVPNDVTANAAVVQRHGEDGEWVGQSGDYRFTVETGAGSDASSSSDTSDTSVSSDASDASDTSDSTRSTDSSDSVSSDPSSSSAFQQPSPKASDGVTSLVEKAGELAGTGPTSPLTALAAAGLLVAGGVLLLVRRLRWAPPPPAPADARRAGRQQVTGGRDPGTTDT